MALKDAAKRSAYMKAWRKKNNWRTRQYDARKNHKEQYAKYGLKRRAKKYGLTLEQYYALYDRQEGQCPICGQHIKVMQVAPGQGQVDVASIDHCHETGTVRGLLCHQCNIGLGAFKDNPVALNNAMSYLRTYEKMKIK